MCQYWNKYYLSHTRDVLLTRALARASAPASPILLPQSLEKQVFCKHLWQMQEKYDVQMVAGWFYPKNLSDLFTLNPSASCFAPSAVILLLPKLFKNC